MSRAASLELPWQAPGPILAGLLALRMAIGWHFLYEGIAKLLGTGWTSADYLSTAEWVFGGVFQGIAKTAWMVSAVDIVIVGCLTLIGLCLLLGVLTRTSCIAGSVLLLLFSLAHPALPGMAGAALGGGSYLIIDRNILEVLALILIAMPPRGQLWGIDRLILLRKSRKSVRTGTEAGDVAVTSSGRRELMKNLAGVPVLGALAAAVAGVRVMGDRAEQADALSGATPLLSASPVLGRTGNIVSVRDFERLAPSYMKPANWAYVSGGAGDEQTLRWNEGAFRQIHLRLQVIHTQTKPDTRLRLLGRDLSHPIMLAPARQGDLHPEGELATVRGAGAAKAVAMISTMATKSIESIAEAATQPVWYQAYLFEDRGRARENVQRAEAAGYEAICVTVDSSSNGPRDRQYRHGSPRNADRFLKHREEQWSWPTTWDDFEWYRSLTKLPVIPKGIMTVEDAERSLELGAEGIYISNHGARNLDSGIATIQVLPAIADRVAGRGPIILDGGIRRGTDILKALALGATAVAVGRPYLYGLAVKGADGVAAAVNMLWNELEMAMISTGRTTISSLDKSAILSIGSEFFSS